VCASDEKQVFVGGLLGIGGFVHDLSTSGLAAMMRLRSMR